MADDKMETSVRLNQEADSKFIPPKEHSVGLSRAPFRLIKRGSISFRLLFYIIICSTFFSIIATFIQLYFDYRKDIDVINRQIDMIQHTYMDTLAYSIWNFDVEAVQTHINGMMNFRDIQYIEVEFQNEDQVVAAGVKKNGHKTKSRDYTISKTFNSENIIVGKLSVNFSLEGVYQRLWSKLIVILLTQWGKTLIVSMAILLIIRYMVTRHLISMSQYARSFDVTKLDIPLRLNRSHRNDEFDQVVHAFNQMREHLMAAFQELEHSARMKGELNAAARIQKAFLPTKAPELNGFDISYRFFSAREVSGDYFDFLPIDDTHCAFVVADASGKGVSASMYANALRVLLHDKKHLFTSPQRLLEGLNASLKNEFRSAQFLTMAYLLLDLERKTCIYVNAGHDPLLLQRGEAKQCELIKPPGYPFNRDLAPSFDNRIQEFEFKLSSGDVVLLYTDGLIDSMNCNGQLFGESRLHGLLHKYRNHSANKIADHIEKALNTFTQGQEQFDDTTLIIIKCC